MSARTFNGKAWADAVSILRDARPPKKDDNGKGKPYVDISQFFIYMDQVFDGLYSYDISEPFVTRLANSQEMVSVKVTLQIRDDNGEVYVTYAGAGTCQLYMNDKGKCTNMQQAYSNASLSAFKDACKGFGIFGYRRFDEARGAKPAASSGSSGSGSGAKGSATSGKNKRECILFVSNSSMYETKRDADDRPIWKLGGTVNNSPAELIFYPSHYSKDAAKFNKLHTRCKSEKLQFGAEVTPCGSMDGKAQYVFLDYHAAS